MVVCDLMKLSAWVAYFSFASDVHDDDLTRRIFRKHIDEHSVIVFPGFSTRPYRCGGVVRHADRIARRLRRKRLVDNAVGRNCNRKRGCGRDRDTVYECIC